MRIATLGLALAITAHVLLVARSIARPELSGSAALTGEGAVGRTPKRLV